MKRFFVILLIFGAAAGAFAQDEIAASQSPLDFSLLVDIRPSLMQYSGSSNSQNIYSSTNQFDLFTHPGNYSTWGPDVNLLKLSMDYRGQFINGHIRMSLDDLVRNGGRLFNNGGKGATFITDILNSMLDEWNVTGKLGFISAFIGNTANRGIVRAYGGFDTLKFRQEQFGIITPSGTDTPDIPWNKDNPVTIPMPTPAGNWTDAPENTNFGKSLNVASNYSQQDVPYFMFSAKFFNYTIDVAGDLQPESTVTGTSRFAINGGVRFSGEKIADLVNFDVTYRLRGGDPNTYNKVDDTDQGVSQPNGDGKTTHSFTLAGQMDNLLNNTLGIQLAYTGQFRVYENSNIGDVTVKQKGPYFSGIDLRAQYTGLENLQFNLNNNISFSSVSDTQFTGSGLDPDTVYDFWDKKVSSAADTGYDWFSMYNALGVQYRLTEKLKLAFEGGHKFSLLTSTEGDAVRKDNYNVSGASLKAVYTFSPVVSVEAGLAFYYTTYIWNINDIAYDASVVEALGDGSDGGVLDTVTTTNVVFQIPLRLRIVF